MIKSSKVSIKFANDSKIDNVSTFIDEYRNVVSSFVNKLWDLNTVPNLLPMTLTSGTDTWLSSRAIQCAGKQASGIVRGTKKKQEKRAWIIKKLIDGGKFKQARKLQRTYDSVNISKPEVSQINPELDSRFVKMDFSPSTSFDGWITLSSLGKKIKIVIPFKKHKHFNEMMSSGKILNGIRLSKDFITFMFELPDVNKRKEGTTIGIDIGQSSIISLSNGQIIEADKHGHTFKTICEKLSRKKKGSKGFGQACQHRTNFINWAVNQINLMGVKKVNRENIRNLRKNKRSSRSLTHWNYAELFGKLDSFLEKEGVLLDKKNPTYTSQRCSKCGWVRKGNRKKKLFKCNKCGFATDADLNASLNLSLPLVAITNQQRLKKINKEGFYWLTEGQEHIVPVANKT